MRGCAQRRGQRTHNPLRLTRHIAGSSPAPRTIIPSGVYMQQRNDRYLSGYRVVYKPEHFNHTLNKKGYDGYVYEHRYVMEVHLGRALAKNEIVHHIDGDKLNNDIDNLQLMTRSERTQLYVGAARVTRCLDCGCEIPAYHNQKRCLKCSRIAKRKVKKQTISR